MAIPETRYKRSVLPTAASDRSSRTRKAPEIFTFTSSKVAPKTKGRGRPKNKANTNTKANTGRVCLFLLPRFSYMSLILLGWQSWKGSYH